jgi:phage recombination protein Bet
MTTALASVQPDSMQPFFTPEQERMILSSFLGGASKQEAAVLMEVARVRRLNPLLRQIHFVKRYDSQKREEVWSYQTSIDGLRTIAERTGRYQGQTKAEWCGQDGVWRDVWLSAEPPAAARVGVFKQGFAEPCYGVAKWTAFVQTKRDGSVTHFWGRMGDLMLAKCAEALAIRKAFPEDTSGLYTDDEMPEHAELGGGHEATPSSRPALASAAPSEPEAGGTLEPGQDPPAMRTPTVEIVAPEPTGHPDAALRERIAACTSLGTLVLLLNDIKRLPPPLNEQVLDAYRARREALKGMK